MSTDSKSSCGIETSAALILFEIGVEMEEEEDEDEDDEDEREKDVDTDLENDFVTDVDADCDTGNIIDDDNVVGEIGIITEIDASDWMEFDSTDLGSW